MTLAALPRSSTRDRILDAAEVLFADRGLAGTSVRDIAQACGLTPGSLYNHFPGKEALYEAVLERGVRPLLDLARELPAREHTQDSLEAVIDAAMRHLAQRPHLPRLIQHEAVTGGLHLARLARTWVRPILLQGMDVMKRDPASPWEEDEHPLVLSAWMHLVLGHFASAPLLREVFDADPLSPESVERQARFLRKLARLVSGWPQATSPQPEGAQPPTPETEPEESPR